MSLSLLPTNTPKYPLPYSLFPYRLQILLFPGPTQCMGKQVATVQKFMGLLVSMKGEPVTRLQGLDSSFPKIGPLSLSLSLSRSVSSFSSCFRLSGGTQIQLCNKGGVNTHTQLHKLEVTVNEITQYQKQAKESAQANKQLQQELDDLVQQLQKAKTDATIVCLLCLVQILPDLKSIMVTDGGWRSCSVTGYSSVVLK